LSEDRLATVAGALLLGGASSRMGEDKAARRVGGEPAARRLARLLASLFEEVLLVGGRPPEGAPGRPVPDRQGAPRCPLRGLVAALEASEAPALLVLATDQLAVTPALLLALAARGDADAVVPVAEGRLQPLCALYRRETVLPVARGHLAEGRLALHALLDVLEVGRLEGPDLEAVAPGGRALRSANTPEAWRALEAELAGTSPSRGAR
jgi:molybdopterin-guanine dinucleotide biosynthesis protein A